MAFVLGKWLTELKCVVDQRKAMLERRNVDMIRLYRRVTCEQMNGERREALQTLRSRLLATSTAT